MVAEDLIVFVDCVQQGVHVKCLLPCQKVMQLCRLRVCVLL